MSKPIEITDSEVKINTSVKNKLSYLILGYLSKVSMPIEEVESCLNEVREIIYQQ